MGISRTDWSEHYNGGRSFRSLGDDEKGLVVEHVPAPEGGRALDVGCGTGEMAVYLASLGYTVDAADFAEGALERARAEHPGEDGVRWLCLDVEHDALTDLAEAGYDLVVMRLAIAFIRDRARVLRRLAARLREDGALVIITPLAEQTSPERRHIALDDGELDALTDGFEHVERFDAHGLAVLILRGRAGSFSAEEALQAVPTTARHAALSDL
ncbi:class I SAM-dependent methyltransferase [Streptomyces sp. NPDC005706]|uniref:class I SAM-dependent methyltransferase n=1 Tax=Streptomyces sp. NPDC005706 TaxID=3157169 RepID=UPI0033E6761F